jgi:hypothetical protein
VIESFLSGEVSASGLDVSKRSCMDRRRVDGATRQGSIVSMADGATAIGL